MVRKGAIPATKVGNQWRFDKNSIDNQLYRDSIGHKASFLVIDDDDIIRALFQETLGNLGHNVVSIGSGLAGLELLKHRDFDLVFLDLRMPQTDGAELFRQIRGVKPELPIIVISGYPESEIMARALVHGPLGVMNKPFKESGIVDAVNIFLRTSKVKKGVMAQEFS